MKIYFDGCSWTKGHTLTNQEEERFSKLVSQEFGAEEYNIAEGGGSNDRIVRNLLVENNIEEYDLAVIEMTFPARTEYYSGVPRQKRVFLSGWISVNPMYNFSHMIWKMKQKILEDIIVHKRGPRKESISEKFNEYQKFWSDYYRTVTTKEFFETKEKIQKLTIENHCQVKGVPLVICTINPWTTIENFELQMNNKENNPSGKGHPDAEGHRILADKIIDIIKSKL